MMAGLALATQTAMALNEQDVYGGGTYSYQINDIKTSAAGGTVTIDYEGDASEVITMTSTATGAGPWTIAGGAYTATFTVEFSEVAAQATNKLVVTITDLDATKACSNFINYEITVYPKPTYTLSIVASIEETCQNALGDAASNDNTPNVTIAEDDEPVSFTFTVVPVFSGIIEGTTFSYTYNIDFENNSVLGDFNVNDFNDTEITYDGVEYSNNDTYTSGYTPREDVFTVSFNTTTGESAQSILGSLSLTSGDAVLTVTGGMTDDAEATSAGSNEDTVVVGAVPTIGSFGN